MKKAIYIIFLSIISSLNLQAQDYYDDPYNSQYGQNGIYNPYDPEDPYGENDEEEEEDIDSTQTNLKPLHHTWQWIKGGVFAKKYIEDSTINNFHIVNPMMRRSQSNTFLAPLPSPNQSNIFFLRRYDEVLYYHNIIRDFLFKETEAPLYNTTTPYTFFVYSSAGSRGRNETTLNVTHSQNILPTLNAGFRYNTIKSDGRYLNQKSRAYDLSLFSNFDNKRFAVDLFLNQNNMHINENGGVSDRSSIKDTTDKTDNVLVNLEAGTENEIRNFNFYTGFQLKLGLYTTIKVKDTITETRIRYEKEMQTLDSIAKSQGKEQFDLLLELEKIFIADKTMKYEDIPDYIKFVKKDPVFKELVKTGSRLNAGFLTGILASGELEKVKVVRYDTIDEQKAKVLLSAKIENNKRNFLESMVSADFFKNNFCSSEANKDQYLDKIYNFSSKLVVNKFPQMKKNQSGMYGGLDLEMRNNRQKYFSDTTGGVPESIKYNTYKYKNGYISAGLFNNDSLSLLTYDAGIRLCFAGKYSGDMAIDGNIRQYLSGKKNSYLYAKAAYSFRNVDRYWENYAGNHDYWLNEGLEREKRLNIEAKYVNTRLRTEIGVAMTNVDGYMMMDSLLNVKQINKPFSTYAFYAKEHFKVWKLNFIESLYLQKSMEEDILSLPLLSTYTSTYIEFETRNKALRAQFGFDVKYDTRFYADNYNPSTMTFYQQRYEKQGNVIYSDVFLNMRISRCNIFAKYEHFDYYLRKGGNYFSAYDYPVNPPLFRIGLRWSFFD